MRRLSKTGLHVVFLILAILLSVINQAGGQAANQTQPPLLTAMGNGEVQVTPDQAQVQLGVETEARTAAEARQQNAERVARIIQAIKALEIPESQIQTSTFQIQPIRRSDQPNQTGTPPIVAYNVSNIITVKTPKLDLVPKIIDDSVAAGANRVDNVSFMLKDDTAARQSALKLAVADARANANTMASAAEVRLVSVYNIQQGGVGVMPPPIYYAAREAVAAPTPILPGQVTVTATVTLSYIIR